MPGAMATRLNALIGMHNEANMFVTCWIGILDTASGKLEYANCGHNPPLLRRADGGAEYLRTRHGPPLAVLPDCVYENSELLLSDDDLLILYTDGVTEAFNAGGEMFGEARLREVAAAAADQPEALVHAIEQKVAEHAVGVEQSDDITLLIVQYHPVSESQ